MDKTQTDHLKAYGIAYWVLEKDVTVEWLLNYRAGSFLIDDIPTVEQECTVRGVSFSVIADAQADAIHAQIADPEVNMEMVKLEKAPKIAVYAPSSFQPWDDAVALVMTYAEIPIHPHLRQGGARRRIASVRLGTHAPRGLHRAVWQVLPAVP